MKSMISFVMIAIGAVALVAEVSADEPYRRDLKVPTTVRVYFNEGKKRILCGVLRGAEIAPIVEEIGKAQFRKFRAYSMFGDNGWVVFFDESGSATVAYYVSRDTVPPYILIPYLAHGNEDEWQEERLNLGLGGIVVKNEKMTQLFDRISKRLPAE